MLSSFKCIGLFLLTFPHKDRHVPIFAQFLLFNIPFVCRVLQCIDACIFYLGSLFFYNLGFAGNVMTDIASLSM